MSQNGITIQQNSFASGEISPEFAGMIDSKLFYTSCRTLENMLVTRSNGVSQRCGIDWKADYTLTGEVSFFRTTKILVNTSFKDIIITVHGTDAAAVFTVLDAGTFGVLYTAAIGAMDLSTASGWDVAVYDQYAVITRGSSSMEPAVFYWTGSAYTWANMSTLYTGSPFPAEAAPVWDGGYPTSVTFMLARFIFIARNAYYGSEAGAPMEFRRRELTEQEEATEHVVTASSAFYYIVDNQDDTGLKWIRGGLFGMAGSARGAWIMTNYDNGLDATNPNTKNYSGYGASDLPAVYIDGAFFYFDASDISPRVFTLDSNGPTSIALGEYSEHIFRGRRPIQMVLQTSPQSIVWILMDDGQLVAFQHEPTTGKAAWSRHNIRNTVIEHIGIVDDRRLVCLLNRNGYRYFAEMERPYSSKWHDAIDAFHYKSNLPATAYVSSAVRIDENGRTELTVNGPIEDNRPYKLVNSGGLIDTYYMVHYAVDPSSQPNEIKKLWLKDKYGDWVTGETEGTVALDPRGYAVIGVSDSIGKQGFTVQGVHSYATKTPILVQFNDGLSDEYYIIDTISNDGTNTTITVTSPLGEAVLYKESTPAYGAVMFDVPYDYTNANLGGETLSVVTDRNSYHETKSDDNGYFEFDKPYMGAVIGEPIDAVLSPRFFTDKLGPNKGRVLHFFPYVINTPGMRYGVTKVNSATFDYDEIEAYSGPTKRLSLGHGATPDCNFWIYSSPGCRLEISHIFYELEVV